MVRSRATPETTGKADRPKHSVITLQISHCPPMAIEMMLHEPDIVGIILLRLKPEIGVDVQGVPGDAFKKVDAVIRGNDMADAFRQMVERRSRLLSVLHPMNMLMDTEQQVCPHVVVQE